MSASANPVVDLEVAGGHRVAVRAVSLGGAQDVGVLDKLHLEAVAEAIEAIADTLGAALAEASPTKASVSFGLEVAIKAGTLVSLITEASGTATLNVTLEWGG